MTDDARPDRHALLELQALLTQIAALRGEGDADRITADDRYRWVLHRLWIAAGNEALAYTQAIDQPVRANRTWATSTTCATTSPTPASPTSTKASSAASPGPVSTLSRPPPSTTCIRSPNQVVPASSSSMETATCPERCQAEAERAARHVSLYLLAPRRCSARKRRRPVTVQGEALPLF